MWNEALVVLVRHIPTWGGRCDNIAGGCEFALLKFAWKDYERHGKKACAGLLLAGAGARTLPQPALSLPKGQPAGRRRYGC